MGQPQRAVLESHRSMTWNVKYYGPLILAIFSVAMLSGKFVGRRLFVVAPAMLVAAFFLSLATLEVRGNVLRYRQFRKWKTIDDKTVLSAGELWPGVIGYIRLSRYVFPWKSLYFILDDRSGLNIFSGENSPLLKYVKNSAHHEYQDASTSGTPARTLSNVALLIVALAGAVFASLIRLLLPPFQPSTLPESPSNANLPVLVIINVERLIFRLSQSFALMLFLCALFIALTIYRRREPNAWIYAMVTGITLTAVFFHFL